MAGLYIHIPFCKQACHYCDFHFSTNLRTRSEIVHAIVTEIALQHNYLHEDSINTIYFGGGTPSLLTEQELTSIFNSVYRHFSVAPSAEITLEANPDDLTQEKLVALRKTGINRLSIGVQSFDNVVLKFLNRAHDSRSAEKCIDDARQADFGNISIDLIYAIQGQDHMLWEKNIQKAVALEPDHISSYSLTIEDKTVFGKWASNGNLRPVDDEIAATQLEMLIDKLENDGFEHYEVSNFGKPGFHSRHNSNYWKQEKYLGIGPSAHSYNGESRQFNASNNSVYLKSLKTLKIPFELEVLTREDKINEYLLTTLRTSWGCDLSRIKNDFNYDILTERSSYLKSLMDKNLGAFDGAVLKLTKAGKLLADRISSDLFLLKK